MLDKDTEEGQKVRIPSAVCVCHTCSVAQHAAPGRGGRAEVLMCVCVPDWVKAGLENDLPGIEGRQVALCLAPTLIWCCSALCVQVARNNGKTWRSVFRRLETPKHLPAAAQEEVG